MCLRVEYFRDGLSEFCRKNLEAFTCGVHLVLPKVLILNFPTQIHNMEIWNLFSECE